MRFAEFFKKATGLEQGPYPFQRAFAEAEADRVPQQPKVNVTFTLIRFLTLVDLDGMATRLGMAFYDKNDTMNTKPKPFVPHRPVTLGIKVGSAKQLLFGWHHEHRKPGKPRPFRRRADAPVGERSHAEHRPPRSGLRGPGHAHRPSPVGRRNLPIRGRERESLGSPVGRWLVGGSGSLEYFLACG